MSGIRGANIPAAMELAAIAGILVLWTFALFAAYDREMPWVVANRPSTRPSSGYETHHEQGLLLASIAAERAGDPHLRALSKLMVVTQRGRPRYSHIGGRAGLRSRCRSVRRRNARRCRACSTQRRLRTSIDRGLILRCAIPRSHDPASQGGGRDGGFAASRWSRPAPAYHGACHP
jgi:hypothetical protein